MKYWDGRPVRHKLSGHGVSALYTYVIPLSAIHDWPSFVTQFCVFMLDKFTCSKHHLTWRFADQLSEIPSFVSFSRDRKWSKLFAGLV